MQGSTYAILSAVGIALGCAAEHVTYRDEPLSEAVLVDASFSQEQASRIVIGLDSWQSRLTGRNVALRFGKITHADAMAQADANTIHVVRSDSIAADCPAHPRSAQGFRTIACWRAGVRQIVIAGDLEGDLLQAVATHELGHAFGLVHCGAKHWESCSPPDTMAELTDQMTTRLSDADAREFCKLHGCSL